MRLKGYLLHNPIQIQQNDSKLHTLNMSKSSESVVEKTKNHLAMCRYLCVCANACVCVCVVCVLCVCVCVCEREREC